jgi:hypothetical protein
MANSWRTWGLSPDDVATYDVFVRRASSCIEDFHHLFARIAGDPGKAQLPGWRERCLSSEVAIEWLAPIFVEFVQGLVLRAPDQAMNESGQKMNFRGRFVVNADHILLEAIQFEFEYLLVAGFGLHYLLTDFPTRDRIKEVNPVDLQREWLPQVLIADHSLRQYDKEQKGVPSGLAEYLYKNRIDTLLRGRLRLGFWRIRKARSYVKNLFWAGILLALTADLQTKGLTSEN